MIMKIDGDWGCGENCGVGDTRKWGPNSIYTIECPICKAPIEFFKDDKKRSCLECGNKVTNPYSGSDCC